ncbi:HAUS augmin-like complex subunit 6 N-terminus-domain-containing protein [Blyttiomyces helicus]|uniref:HAUS augmin-like complex subunit 6 N-terminus-domain-containing protein n=1 Tax=Blyttiomyces helicus TaxID=388810 RepID=A0A4P9W1H9_9FUNG|nr:HAUS augmin-like complex subunit 6 N-terminus-domain-containing protein [Blyttiomyces helicus]|eukprot:RKO85522.1 HAUS augmin-like complex subunit 6 N-terminus-domain-containing protein [Blyttiomyces helicus]
MSTPSPLDQRSLFWSNLMLLGFDSHAAQPSRAASAQHGALPQLGKDMFSPANASHSANAMEAVVWFLCQKIDPAKAKERFSTCHPVLDRVQAREFRATTVRWLEQLKKEGHLPADVLIRKSYFDECRGERSLLALSVYTLKVVIERDYPGEYGKCGLYILEFLSISMFLNRDERRILMLSSVPAESDGIKQSHAVLQIQIRSLKAKNLRMANAFLAETRERMHLQAEWTSCAEGIAERYNAVVKEKVIYLVGGVDCHEISKKRAAEDLPPASGEESALMAQRRREVLERLRGMWRDVEEWILANRKSGAMAPVLI